MSMVSCSSFFCLRSASGLRGCNGDASPVQAETYTCMTLSESPPHVPIPRPCSRLLPTSGRLVGPLLSTVPLLKAGRSATHGDTIHLRPSRRDHLRAEREWEGRRRGTVGGGVFSRLSPSGCRCPFFSLIRSRRSQLRDFSPSSLGSVSLRVLSP